MSLRKSSLSLLPTLLPASLLVLGLGACDDGAGIDLDDDVEAPHAKAETEPEIDYSECEAVQTMECGDEGCGSAAEQAVVDVVMDEIQAAGLESQVLLGDLHSEGEWVAITMVYQNDWVRAPFWLGAGADTDEDTFRSDVQSALAQFGGVDPISLDAVDSILAGCSPELVLDPCTDLSAYNGLSARVDWVSPSDECQGVNATVDLVSGAISCWEVDLCDDGGGDTPLVVKFDNAPVEFAPAAAGTSFDIAGAGECTSHDWPSAATPWLALDRDQSGSIDSGAELFGSGTVLSGGDKASNGFEALAELDTNGDGQISRADEDFASLVLWSDYDGDKRSTFAEAPTAQSMGLLSIDLDYRVDASCDGRGNCEVERATFRFVDDHGALGSGEVADVHLACQ